MMSRSKIFFSILLLLVGSNALAQTPPAIEKELLGSLETMSKYGSYGGEYDEEKLEAASKAFKQTLMNAAVRRDVLTYAFPKLKESMFIATSRDGKLRVYSWDLESGGTMHDYDRVIQFVGTGGRVIAWSDNDESYEGSGAFYTDIFQVTSKGGPIYLIVGTSRGSSSLNGQSLNAVRIIGDDIDLAEKVIRTSKGLTHEVGFSYDFFSVVDRPERPIRLFKFDEARKEFSFPVVIEDDETPQGRVTNRFITYRYNGKHFVKVN